MNRHLRAIGCSPSQRHLDAIASLRRLSIGTRHRFARVVHIHHNISSFCLARVLVPGPCHLLMCRAYCVVGQLRRFRGGLEAFIQYARGLSKRARGW